MLQTPHLPKTLVLLDALVRSDVSFALFRMPGEEEPVLVMQANAADTQLPGFDRVRGAGFVLAPFCPDQGHAVTFLKAERVFRGWAEIAGGVAAVAETIRGTPAMPYFAAQDYEVLKKRLFSAGPDAGYAWALEAFQNDLRGGHFDKIVLSRSQDIPGSFSPGRIFARACEANPDALCSLVHGHCGTWLGASPEALLVGEGDKWSTMALAATREAGTEGPWDAKNLREHAIVSDFVRDVLAGSPVRVDSVTGPYGSPAGEVEHLRTDFSFTLAPGADPAAIVLSLHPTPAVCGLPRREAMRRILTSESLDRRYYAGYLGWWNERGRSGLYVNLRCMKLSAGGARLYAGGGIVPGSTLEGEWRETCAKMCTMLSLLSR